MGSTANLVADPGFESSTVGTNYPDQWGRWIQPVDSTAIGEIASNTSAYGCNASDGGSLFWCDSSVEGYDGIFQTIATTSGTKYNINFYLADNSGENCLTSTTGSAGYRIDTLVYALAGINTIPVGTAPIVIPPPPSGEPASLFLFGTGVVDLSLMRGRVQGSMKG